MLACDTTCILCCCCMMRYKVGKLNNKSLSKTQSGMPDNMIRRLTLSTLILLKAAWRTLKLCIDSCSSLAWNLTFFRRMQPGNNMSMNWQYAAPGKHRHNCLFLLLRSQLSCSEQPGMIPEVLGKNSPNDYRHTLSALPEHSCSILV